MEILSFIFNARDKMLNHKKDFSWKKTKRIMKRFIPFKGYIAWEVQIFSFIFMFFHKQHRIAHGTSFFTIFTDDRWNK